LEKKFCLVGSLQPEHMLLFVVVGGFSGDGVVDPNCVVQVVVHLALAESVLILVQVHDHVSKGAVEHFPTPLSKWGYARNNHYKRKSYSSNCPQKCKNRKI